MRRQFVRAVLVLGPLSLFSASARLNGEETKPDPAAAAQTARNALSKLDKSWKPYENKPNLNDARWKFLMEALVHMARSGPAALPVLEAAAKEGSAWSDSTRTFAAKVLTIMQGPTAVRNAIAEYGLAQMDTAHVGKPAPDFALPDAGGKTYRLSHSRHKKVVVLTFIAADT